MGPVPDLNRASSDEDTSTYGAPVQATQLVGCYLCLMDGNVEQPSVIYHLQGTTYCMDHLYGHITQLQAGGRQ